MGAGKSRSVVELVARDRPRRTLIVCPKAVVPVWPDQFRIHTADDSGIMIVPLVGKTVARRVDRAREAWRDAGDSPLVLVTNYDAVWRTPMGDAFLNAQWDTVVIDEAHRAKAVSGKASRWLGRVSNRAHKRIALSGTPMPHTPLDIWAQSRFLQTGLLGSSFVRFRAQYAIMGGYQMREVRGFQKLDELQQRIRPWMHVVSKSDMQALRGTVEPTSQYRSCEMPVKAWRVYRAMERDMLAEVENGEISAANGAVKMLRLQQISGGSATLDEGGTADLHHAKSEALTDTLEDIPSNDPVVVFARFRHDLDEIQLAAEKSGRRYEELSGRRRDVEAVWRPEHGGTVLGVQIQAGGEGVDLTAASTAIYFSGTWSLGSYDQSIARLDRQGQTKPVTLIHLVVRDTVDEIIYKALNARRNVIEALMDRIQTGATVC